MTVKRRKTDRRLTKRRRQIDEVQAEDLKAWLADRRRKLEAELRVVSDA